jgi:hypothetical protein
MSKTELPAPDLGIINRVELSYGAAHRRFRAQAAVGQFYFVPSGVCIPTQRQAQIVAVELGQLGQTGRSPTFQRKAAALVRGHEPDDARVSRPESVRGSG